MLLRRLIVKVPTIAQAESLQIAQFSTQTGGYDRRPPYSRTSSANGTTAPSGSASSGSNPAFRRTLEAKGAMKSFFDTGASNSNEEPTAPTSSAGASIWQRLKRDAGNRLAGDVAKPQSSTSPAASSDGQRSSSAGTGSSTGRPYTPRPYTPRSDNRGPSQTGSAPRSYQGPSSGASDGSVPPRRTFNQDRSGAGSRPSGAGGAPGNYNRTGGSHSNTRVQGGNGYTGSGKFGGRNDRGASGSYIPGLAANKSQGGAGGGRRMNNNRGAAGQDQREDKEKVYDVGEIEHSLLKDYEYFEDLFAQGGHINATYMDPLDQLLSEVFEESFKTKDGEVMTVMELTSQGDIRRNLIHTKPRPMAQLLTHSILPDIHSVPRGTFAHQTASYAWDAISKNPYYSEYQRNWMCNRIGKLTQKAFEFPAEKHYNTEDQVLDPNFRYGTMNKPEEQLEFEARVKVLRELETGDKGITKLMRRTRHDDVLDESLKYFVTPDVAQYFTVDQMTFEEEQSELLRKQREFERTQGRIETDWSIEAVVDEDQL